MPFKTHPYTSHHTECRTRHGSLSVCVQVTGRESWHSLTPLNAKSTDQGRSLLQRRLIRLWQLSLNHFASCFRSTDIL